mmetsp:Transcript_5738/g.14904  ORF Transcript_5738/g.14904 Transcript_5738/m.14904 type:complete len:141 (+) Transcript_5738:43-465(+)
MSRYQRGEPNLAVPASQPPNIGLSRCAVLKISHSVRVGFSTRCRISLHHKISTTIRRTWMIMGPAHAYKSTRTQQLQPHNEPQAPIAAAPSRKRLITTIGFSTCRGDLKISTTTRRLRAAFGGREAGTAGFAPPRWYLHM